MSSESYFKFNGGSSLDYGLVIEAYPIVTAPEKDITEILVPGSSEPLHQWNGSFKPFARKYKCWFAKSPVAGQARKMKEWLENAPASSRLEDSYSPSEWHKATFIGPMDITNVMDQLGRFTVEFRCAAPAFLTSGDKSLTFTGEGLLNNPTSRPSLPLIQVTGSVSGLVKIGDAVLTILFSGYNDVHTFWVDCHLREAWEEVDGVEVNRNEWVSSQEFPAISPGTNHVEITGGITSVNIWPRWWTV